MSVATPKVLANCLAFCFVALLFYYVAFSSYLLLDLSKASAGGRGGSKDAAALSLSDLRFVPILTKNAGDLTPLELYETHGREPVIIKGALNDHPLMRAGRNTPEYIAQVCGDALIGNRPATHTHTRARTATRPTRPSTRADWTGRHCLLPSLLPFHSLLHWLGRAAWGCRHGCV